MTDVMLLLAVLGGIAVLYVLVPVIVSAFLQYRGRRTVRCPETGTSAEVQIDAGHAALTAVPGPPDLLVRDCSRWPERADCGQDCLAAR
jgi:hypothetical protein